MLRSCVCIPRRKRRSSSFEDSSSCRSSEIERGVEATTTTATGNTAGRGGASSLLQLLQSKGWYRHWRKPGRGMSMTKVERTMKAALLIQRWYRRYLARMEARRRYTWYIFQNLEYAGEQDQIELYNFFNALITHIPEAAAKNEISSSSSKTSTENLTVHFSDESEADEGASDKSKDAGKINFPLTRKDIDILIDLFRKKKSNYLAPKYVGNILKEAAIRLRRLPNLNQASTAISKQITICGDLHGKLDDLLVVFHKNGLPSTENPYVFNGDFVDRGKKGLEVFLLLLACFLAFPGGVFLNRGNHEDSVMNARYGFIREVQVKYGHNADKIFKLIEEVYRWLPLGTIINNRVLVVHGGISDSTNLDMLKSLDRGKYVSILRPPVEAISGEGIDKAEWKQLFDIMWSDPQHYNGCEPNTLRGAGTYFGPDITENFLDKYKLKYLVRSHECKPDGHEFAHNDKVITIFSASNYYAIGSNKGAYLKLNPQLDPHFVQYISAASKTRKLTFRQRVGHIESSAIRELGARLRAHRDELEQEFEKHNIYKNGLITVTQWCDAMDKSTGLSLPWRYLRDKLAPMPEDSPPNLVNFYATLELLDTDIIVAAQMAETSVADSLYKNKSSLEAIFHILDKDHSGQISLEEFGEACDLLQKHLPGATTREELLEYCKMMDINKDGQVDLNEFLEAFRLSDLQRQRMMRSRSTLPPKVEKLQTLAIQPADSAASKSDSQSSPKMDNNSPNSPRMEMLSSPRLDKRNSLTVSAAAARLAVPAPEVEGDADIDPTDHESRSLLPKLSG